MTELIIPGKPSSALGRRRCTINWFLSRLVDKGKIKKVGFKRGGIEWCVNNG